jgi:predicted Holliday junction resolvase-like endonuclease
LTSWEDREYRKVEMTEILMLLVFALFLAVILLARAYMGLRSRLLEVISRKQSMSVKYGRMTEQFIPFLDLYPYDENRFRFLGNPVDGVQFNDDGIVFVEFKSAGSRLTPEQKRIRDMVERKKVSFDEIRIPHAD